MRRTWGQQAHVVEQRHGLGPVHFVPAGIFERKGARDSDLHGGMSADRTMERFDRHAEHTGSHEEQPRGLVGKTLLLGLEWHPSGIRRASDAPSKAQVIVLHAGLSDTSGDAQISLAPDREGEPGPLP